MIKQRFALDEIARLYLDLTARKRWHGVQLSLRGTALGPPLSPGELSNGQSYTLPDGSELLVQLSSPLFMPVLRIERDGVALPGSEGSAEALTENAGRWQIGLGVLTGLFALALGTNPEMALARKAGFISATFFIMIGFLTRRGSVAALAIGSGFFLLSVLSDLGSNGLLGLLVQIVFLTPMFRAVRAHYRERKGVVRPLRRTDVPLAAVRSVTRPPSEFAETIAPNARPRVAAANLLVEAPPDVQPTPGAPAPRPTSGKASQPDGSSSEPRFGSYVVTGTLGSGAMATVYRARQTSVGRDVALKVITGSQAEDREFIERFRREAETTAALSHPHILKVFDYGEDGGRPYLAMEYMSGGTLRSRIAGAQLPLAQVAKWAEQIGQAMNSAHSQGVVHRDIKPENVLLDQDGNAFLADFGLARLSDAKGNLTQAGTQMGSPSYMAPEQWHGADVTAAADLYAFAVMLFELLCGRPPFVADSLPALMTQHVRSRVPALSEFRPGLPAALDAFFTRALSKGPNLRFESAAAMVTAFQASLVATPRPAPRTAERPQAASPQRVTPQRVASSARPVPKAGQPSLSSNVRLWLGLAAALLIVLGGLQAYRKSILNRKGADPRATDPVAANAPVAANTMTGSMHPLDFRPLVVKFSKSLNLIVATVDRGSRHELVVIDPATARFDQIQLTSRPTDVAVSPDGLTAAVMQSADYKVSIINLATRAVERVVSMSWGVSGNVATNGTWAYVLPRMTDSRLRSINLATEDVQIGRDNLPNGVFLLHPSSRRAYDLAPDDLSPVNRLEMPMGPLAEVLPNKVPLGRVLGYEQGFWFSERGDYLFTSHGQVFLVTDDPSQDLTSAGQIAAISHVAGETRMHETIVSLSHSEAAGRIVAAVSEDASRVSEFVTTYRFPGLKQVASEPLPPLGTADHPVRASVTFLATSIDGKWVYALAEARQRTDWAGAGLFVGPLR